MKNNNEIINKFQKITENIKDVEKIDDFKIINDKNNNKFIKLKYLDRFVYIPYKNINNLSENIDMIDVLQSEDDNYTLKKYIQSWLYVYKNDYIKNTTYHDILSIIKRYIEPNIIYLMDIREITPILLQQCIRQTNKTRAQQKIYITLHDIFNHAFNEGIMNKNYMKLIKKPKHDKKENEIIEFCEFEKFCKISDEVLKEYSIYIKLILFTGIRFGELMAITKNDIDLENKTILIDKQLNEYNQITTTKTNNKRKVLIANILIDDIKEKLKEDKFINFNREHLKFKYKKLQKEIEIRLNKHIRIHDLRHSFASALNSQGVSPGIIKKLLGHSTITTTFNYYIMNILNKMY